MVKKSQPKIQSLKLLLMIIIGIIFIQNIYSLENNKVDLVMFYGDSCPHCHSALEELKPIVEEDSNLNLIKYEVYSNNSNRLLFKKYAKAYNSEVKGVPTFFISNKTFIGFKKEEILELINYCENNPCKNPSEIVGNPKNEEKAETTKTENENEKEIPKITILAVILGAFIDAINPCAFAVLILLLTTVLSSKNRKKALFCGFAFILAIFISYFLMGLGVFSAIASFNISKYLLTGIGIFSIILGLFNLKDYFFYGKWFITEVPLKWRPKLKKLISKVISIPGAFITGFLVSLFLLPCTSGPYLVILTMLANSQTKISAIFLLVLYNLIFIFPMILINLVIYFNLTNIKKAEKMRVKNLKNLHLIGGIILIILGIIILTL